MDCGTGTVFCSLKDNERFYRSVYACVGFPLITRFTYFSFFFADLSEHVTRFVQAMREELDFFLRVS